jgi:hypothetical protein
MGAMPEMKSYRSRRWGTGHDVIEQRRFVDFHRKADDDFSD